MGQRSQIYFRYNGELLFASYFQWNFGERMISRARWGIEYVKQFLDGKFDFAFCDPTYIERFRRIFDTNFDMKDVAISRDIVKEHEELFSSEQFNDCVFNRQDNNDGQLYVDIKDGKIFYCFRDWVRHKDGTTDDVIMSAEEYMDWDVGEDGESWQENKYIPDEQKTFCRRNIKRIEKMAKLMTMEQLDDFIHGDYEPTPF